ncbi:MAG: adenylate/guanylate cyclase domain-containing protein [Stellaceae bacterium]
MGARRIIVRYREERFYPKPPEAIWPFIADTARINDLVGMVYRFEEVPDSDGRVRRFAKGKLGPSRARWEESFGEWQVNRHLQQVREIRTGPIRRLSTGFDIEAEGTGSRVVFWGTTECVGLLGLIAKYAGLVAHEARKRTRLVDRMIREDDLPNHVAGASERALTTRRARQRLGELAGALAQVPESHGLVPRLVDFLAHAPDSTLRGIRPLALAERWGVGGDETIELFLAAQARGLLAMGWDLLCPRCRGAKARASHLDELPKGAHCSSCNIDYERNFDRNVELTFHPAPWLRPLPDGEFCMLGQGATPHVKFQAEVAARSDARFDLDLAPGPYRFRTVEAGGEQDRDIAADGAIPAILAEGAQITLREPGNAGEVAIRNDTDRPLGFVIEDRRWASDALTGDRVIATPAFRRLCPEQLLRPGDDAEIGRATLMFTDLQGSTRLYDALGDARAYRLVRDHFAYLAEHVHGHRGAVVKTVGDAVMAVFQDPADAVRAALAIQDDVAAFNHDRGEAEIVLKLGLHAGACIAVTAGGILDYFGATVNIAARLEHRCLGGEIVISEAILEDAAARAALAGRAITRDHATLRGVSEAVPFVRIGHAAEAAA